MFLYSYSSQVTHVVIPHTRLQNQKSKDESRHIKDFVVAPYRHVLTSFHCIRLLLDLCLLTLRRLTSYIYGAPILDVSRSHTTTQHSR